jgi:hypothetical protein
LRSAEKVTQSLAANISADIVAWLQYYGSLDQLKSQCRDAGDCHHRPHNYDGTCAPASARQSVRIRSCRLFPICKPSDDLSFHLVHRCNQMHALTRASQNTSAMSSSVTFVSPLSTPIHRKTARRVASPIGCHSDMSFLSDQDLLSTKTCREPNDRECKPKSNRKWRSPPSSWR